MNYTLFSEVLRGRFKFLICFQNTCTGALCTSCYTDGRCHGQTSVWGTTSKRFSHTVAIVLFTSIALLKCSQIYCAMAPLVTPFCKRVWREIVFLVIVFITFINLVSNNRQPIYYSILLILCQVTPVGSRGSQYSSSHDFLTFLAFCSAIIN